MQMTVTQQLILNFYIAYIKKNAYIPRIVLSIECKEEWCHHSVATVEQLDVVGLDGVEKHEDKMTMVNEGHPEGSCLPQITLTCILLKSLILPY